MLNSPAFKSDGQSEQQIDVNFLICYGLLLCSGTPREKAECLLNILQSEGIANHSLIAAIDLRENNKILRKMCLLVTVHLFEFMKDTFNMEKDWEFVEDKLIAA